LIGQCKFDGIYFVFFFPPQKEKKNPTYIAAHLQAPQLAPTTRGANAQKQNLQKSCNFAYAPVPNCYICALID
jgi:hypothetical protein